MKFFVKNKPQCKTLKIAILGTDSRVLLPSRDVREHERVQARTDRGRVGGEQRRAAAVGLEPARVRPDQPAGPRVGVRLLPDPPVD